MALSKLTMFNYVIDGVTKPIYVNLTEVEGIRQDKSNVNIYTVYMTSGNHFTTDSANAMAIRDAVNAF